MVLSKRIGQQLDPGEVAMMIEAAGLRGNRGIESLSIAALRSRNPAWRERLLKLLGPRLAAYPMVHPFGPSPDGEVANGDVSIGEVVWADGSIAGQARIPLLELTRGTFFAGTTGGGKTFAVAHSLRQLTVPFWVFDPHHEYHRFFADRIRTGDVLVLDYKEVRRNLLEPAEGANIPEAIGAMSDVWRRNTYIKDGGQLMFKITVRKLFTDYHIFEGATDYPSIFELRDALAKMRPSFREAEYHSSLMNRIDGLITVLGETYNCSRGFPMSELLKRSIIFRVGGMDAMTYAFFVDDLLTAALAHRRVEHVTQPDMY